MFLQLLVQKVCLHLFSLPLLTMIRFQNIIILLVLHCRSYKGGWQNHSAKCFLHCGTNWQCSTCKCCSWCYKSPQQYKPTFVKKRIKEIISLWGLLRNYHVHAKTPHIAGTKLPMDVLRYLILSSVIYILMLFSVCNAQKQLKVQLDDSKNYPAQKLEAPLCPVLPCFLSKNTTTIYVF
jgi:hypothetical protein